MHANAFACTDASRIQRHRIKQNMFQTNKTNKSKAKAAALRYHIGHSRLT
jgi:hypothetical protein